MQCLAVSKHVYFATQQASLSSNAPFTSLFLLSSLMQSLLLYISASRATWLYGQIQLMFIMQIDDDATPEEIKAAYRYLAKQCHPDQRGDIGHDMCVLLNEVIQPQTYSTGLLRIIQDT